MICKPLQQQAAPHLDNVKFYGKPIKYLYFMSLFKEIVEDRIEDPRGRPKRLIKYTDGQAWEPIKSCVQQPTHIG